MSGNASSDKMILPDHFITEFGHRIDFIPGWNDSISKGFLGAIDDHHFKKQPLRTMTPGPNWTPERTYENAYLKNLVSFSHFLRFLEQIGRAGSWGTSIDLGGGYGTFSALLKAGGFVSHATSVDILDYSATAPDFQRFVDNLDSITADGAKRISMAKDVFDLFPNHQSQEGLFRYFPQPAVVDEFRHQDLFDTNGTFDLVTSIATIDLYDLDISLAKVRSLLSEKGLFVCVEEYPWWVMTSACIFGHFPYTAQRLTQSDLKLYVSEHHLDMLPSIEARSNFLYAGKMPTLADFLSAAERQSLRVVGYVCTVAKRHHRLPLTVPQMLKKSWFNLAEIMRDIKQIRPDVSADDLTTSIVTLAMVRA